MSYTILFQDWTTIQGGAGVTVVQSEPGWANLRGAQDVQVMTEISAYTGATLTYKNAPLKNQDSAWGAIVTHTPTATGFMNTVVRSATATNLLYEWLRWEGSGGAAWNITFRTFLIINPIGGALPQGFGPMVTSVPIVGR